MDEGPDIIDTVKNTLRKHPVGGWILLIFIVIAWLATTVNQVIDLFKSLP